MTDGGKKRIAVVVDSYHPHRIGEALRAAIGLGLRGDTVVVALLHAPKHTETLDKSLATLRAVGHVVVSPHGGHELMDVLRDVDAVEVWH